MTATREPTMTEREARERAALAAEAVRGRKAAASARQAQDQVERLTTQMLSLKEEVARLGSQIEAANERHEAALTEITGSQPNSARPETGCTSSTT